MASESAQAKEHSHDQLPKLRFRVVQIAQLARLLPRSPNYHLSAHMTESVDCRGIGAQPYSIQGTSSRHGAAKRHPPRPNQVLWTSLWLRRHRVTHLDNLHHSLPVLRPHTLVSVAREQALHAGQTPFGRWYRRNRRHHHLRHGPLPRRMVVCAASGVEDGLVVLLRSHQRDVCQARARKTESRKSAEAAEELL